MSYSEWLRREAERAESWGELGRAKMSRAAAAHIERLEERAEKMENALESISEWTDAYPLQVFPEPNFVAVREALEARGISLDRVCASNMRHVATRVGALARAALSTSAEEEGS